MVLVRQGDKDRFLATLFAPDEARPYLWALYAFNLEIARIRDAVSEPELGLIRQQWWLDTLDAIGAGDVPAHPVAQALAQAIAEARLPIEPLRNLIIAREFDLHADSMPDLEALETYLGETCSALMQLAAVILAGDQAAAAAETTGLAGVAYGFALLLSDPVRRQSSLPPGMDVASAVTHAKARLAEARQASSALPRAALPAVLPASLTELYLGKAERDPDSLSPASQFRRQLTMWWYARQDRF